MPQPLPPWPRGCGVFAPDRRIAWAVGAGSYRFIVNIFAPSGS